MNPYREAQKPVEPTIEEVPEAILFDTLKRLKKLNNEDDVHSVVRALAAYIGFDVGRRGRDGIPTVDSDEEEEDEDDR